MLFELLEFDPKSRLWIELYRLMTVVASCLIILFGFIAGIGDATCEFLDLDLGGDGILDFFVWFFASCIISFVQLIANMLLIQLLNNVQLIREKLEAKSDN